MTNPLDAAAAALATRPAEAERQARTLLTRMPGDPRPRLILASALRRLDRPGEALPYLAELAKAWPRAARTRYELGLCLGALGHHADALTQIEAATTLDPALAEAWVALADVAFAMGDATRERRAQAALARLDQKHPTLARAAELIVLGDHAQAEPMLQRHLSLYPDDAQAARLLAQCYVVVQAFENAETLLRHVLTLQPKSVEARFDLARALFARQQGEIALIELAPLLERDPGNHAFRNLQAGCLALLGDDHAAEAIQRSLAEQFPTNPAIAINHGHALRTAGQRDEAIAAYRRAVNLRPSLGEGWWSLANLKVGVLDDRDEMQMHRLLGGALDDIDRLHLEYALARRAEDAGKAREAFAHYAAGAALMRRRIGAGLPDYDAELAGIRDLFTPEFYAARQGWGHDDPAPIFVLGLPRSGSTLVEQILASHPAIEGTMELPFIPALAGRISREGGFARIAQADAATVAGWGEAYMERARIHRRLGRAHFIDKMPNNFRNIGLIRLILPQARIIDVRRHPLASGFSCFKQLFAEGQEFSYDLADLARYYRHYLAIIRHFGQVAPGAIHTLVYEDLVEDTEARVRDLLDAVGLDFDPATLRFFENDRAVRTVSSEQVRQPIYRVGLDHWKAFADDLGPLSEGLGEALTDWRS